MTPTRGSTADRADDGRRASLVDVDRPTERRVRRASRREGRRSTIVSVHSTSILGRGRRGTRCATVLAFTHSRGKGSVFGDRFGDGRRDGGRRRDAGATTVERDGGGGILTGFGACARRARWMWGGGVILATTANCEDPPRGASAGGKRASDDARRWW